MNRVYPEYIGPFPDPRGGTINIIVTFKDGRNPAEYANVGNIGITGNLLSIHINRFGSNGEWEWGKDDFEVIYFSLTDVEDFTIIWSPEGTWEGPNRRMRNNLT